MMLRASSPPVERSRHAQGPCVRPPQAALRHRRLRLVRLLRVAVLRQGRDHGRDLRGPVGAVDPLVGHAAPRAHRRAHRRPARAGERVSTVVLSIGIAVTFLTVWGVIMIGSYLLRGDATVVPGTTDT